MEESSIADPSTTARWSAAMQSDKIVPQWSLRQSCLCRVKDSVLGWSRGRRNSVPAQSNENPFYEYPIDLRHELLINLLRLKPTGRELLKAAELLVSSGIPSFDLSCLDDCKFSDVRNVLEVLTKTGFCLKELTIAGQWLFHDFSDSLVQEMLRSCPNLRSLKLQHTTHEGKELEIALRHCPKLQRLEIMHPSIDESDIEDLVEIIKDDPAFEHVKRTLVEIRLPSSVNGRGVLKLLKALPNLQYISCTYLDQVIDELEDLQDLNELSYWRERVSTVRGIHVSLPVCEDTPALILEWFPNLEEISLEVQEEMDLKPLANLSRLRSLELKNSPTIPLSYMEEVLPLVASCGKKLLSLSLERFDLIDLAKTATYCPNLRSFSAQWFTILSTSVARGVKKQFLNLRFLRLRPRVNRKVSPEACELLLTNSQCLKHLEFYCSYGLTDSLVNNLLKTNKFTQLRTLLLRHGHGLSSNGILQITRTAQNLRVWDVGMIYSKQVNA
ncbi:uncharacterized protein LOC129221492 [Uloborus diversus]|uniref:uncharacterized protein LOC129221492 n=1 Tax=Uloborus diversus TaxID=327109 RepID=UPI0024098AA5|nr:uncharacterized protein LOC129221492 [Uloborus diversus]